MFPAPPSLHDTSVPLSPHLVSQPVCHTALRPPSVCIATSLRICARLHSRLGPPTRTRTTRSRSGRHRHAAALDARRASHAKCRQRRACGRAPPLTW